MRRALAALLAAFAAHSGVAGAPPRATGISHVAYFTSDMATARAFYGGVLGLAEESGGVFRINRRQFVQLLPEKTGGSDRLDHVAFTADISEPSSETDPDGHRLEFVPDSSDAQPDPPRALSHQLAHVGVLVGSLGRALAFWHDALGFEETWRGSKDGMVLNWVNLRTPGGSDYVEFMLYSTRPEPDKRGSEHHICLFVPDIEKARAEVAARGYKGPLVVRTGVNRRRQLNLFDPDGTRTELMEPGTVDGSPMPSSPAPPPR